MSVLKLIDGGGGGSVPEPQWHLIYTDALDVNLARQEWARLVADMNMACSYTPSNLHSMERLVFARVIFNQSRRHIVKNGAVLISNETCNVVLNKHWSIVRQADAMIRALEAELCLSPYRRAKVGRVKSVAGTTAADRYLARANRHAHG